jgi:hypothetical protein
MVKEERKGKAPLPFFFCHGATEGRMEQSNSMNSLLNLHYFMRKYKALRMDAIIIDWIYEIKKTKDSV